MVPKLHKKGASFKGAALYLLHDKGRAITSERVAWTQTRNLAVANPDMAWRVMAATAMDRDRLKQNAGIKATGRKSDKSVLHLTLSWHPDEAKSLSRHDMKLAASGAIEAIGAQNHQAMLIAHNDEVHPHIHILVNRINPNDGRMLPSSKEKLHLSQWAEVYEKQRGKIYCDARVQNNEARSRGEYTRGAKVLDRQAYEALQMAHSHANENHDAAAQLKIQHRKIDADFSEKNSVLRKHQKEEWQELNAQVRKERAALPEMLKKKLGECINLVRKDHELSWRDLNRRHMLERETFNKKEETFIGKFHNARGAIELSGHIHKGDRLACIVDLFSILSKRSAREKTFMKRQTAEQKALAVHQRGLDQELTNRMKKVQRYAERRIGRNFLSKREKLVSVQQRERRELRKEWRMRRNEALRPWHELEKGADQEKATNPLDDKGRMKQRIKEKFRKQRERGLDRDGR